MSFSHPDVAAVVLAAGMGKRMNSDLAKVLHEMAGKPLLAHVLDTLDDLGVARVVAVIGHQRELVQAKFADLFACRARGEARTHSSSCFNFRWRADSCFSCCARRADFCSSQPE